MALPANDENLQPGRQPPRNPLVILTPVYNDWQVIQFLLAELDAEFTRMQERASIIAIDDGSLLPPNLDGLKLSAIDTLEVLRLRRNVGHQRAIAIGLALVEAQVPCDLVVVMDADGEDKPSDVLRLVERARQEGNTKLVFALRQKRSEGLVFKACYTLYRFAFTVLTGQVMRFGNFSVVPRSVLRRLVAVSEIWNHYASGVQRARVPCVYVPTDRGHRLSGQSTMNFVSLVAHGMSAISVHAEVLGARMLIVASALGLCIVLVMGIVVGVKLFTTLAIPGWATFVIGLLALMLLQTFFIALFFVGTILHGRNAYTFLPRRDFSHFVDSLELIDVQPER